MNFYPDSIKHAPKQQNEDLWLSVETKQHGHLLMVLDFASHNITNAGLKFNGDIKQLIGSLDTLSGLTDELFLGYVGKDINNYVYEQGQKLSGGHLSCVAAICLLHQNRLIYLSYGDARINIYTNSKLILLNGAKYVTPTVIDDIEANPLTVDDKPESFGRKYLDSPLTERIRSTAIKDTDVVLIFSDGLEEAASPQRRLSELRRINSIDPKSICEALLQATNSAQDDRTLIVITGPYEKYVDPVIGNISTSISGLQNLITTINDNQILPLSEEVKTIKTDLGRADLSIRELKLQLEDKADSSALDQDLARRIEILKTSLLERLNKDKKSKSATTSRAGGGRGEADHPTDNSFGPLLDQWVSNNPEEWRHLVASTNPALATGESDKVARPAGADVNNRQSREQVEPDRLKGGIPRVVGFGAQQSAGEDQSRLTFFLWLFVALFVGVIMGVIFAKQSAGPPSDVWLVRAEQSRFVLIHQTEGRANTSLPIQLSRPLPAHLPPESQFPSFDEAQAYMGKYVVEPEVPRASTEETPSPQLAIDVVVRNGDSIERLAQRHNTTPEKLRELNRNVDWNKLQAGKKIAVPYASGSPQ